jgi:hypothetical protein
MSDIEDSDDTRWIEAETRRFEETVTNLVGGVLALVC